MPRSRLEKNIEKRTIKNILLAIAGTLVILFLLFNYGLQLLVNFSLTIEKLWHPKDTTVPTQNAQYIEPPSLNPPFTATNSAQVDISGAAIPKESISLYVNGKAVDKASVKDDRSFVFRNVTLDKGQNDIKAKATQDNAQSDYSETISIVFSDKAPTLSIDSPQDGESFHKDESPIKISGKTDPGAKVTANDFWAIVDDQGNYFYNYPLKDGDNDITVVSVDAAGNKETKQIKIHVN